MVAGVTHELITFSLSLRDMRLSPITLSTFLRAFTPAVILVLYTIANYLVDFPLGNENCECIKLIVTNNNILHVGKLLVESQRVIIYV